MVAFTLAHDTRFMLPLGLSVLLALGWLTIAIVWLILRARKGARPSRAEWIELALAAGGILVVLT